MVNLFVLNNDVFIFDVDDWYYLRKNYRIIGDLMGSLNNIPLLPLRLTPEEVKLLAEKEIVKFLKHGKVDKSIQELQNELLEEEKQIYLNDRKKQLKLMMDAIITSKRKKGDTRSESEIFEDELMKSCQVNEKTLIWPILTTSINKNYVPTEYKFYQNTTYLRCAIFKDLWQRGFYITSGQKFGGDFLVYKGDPIIFHAIFIVRCIENVAEPIKYQDIVAFGRLGTSVKKRTCFATLINNEVVYTTIGWIDDID